MDGSRRRKIVDLDRVSARYDRGDSWSVILGLELEAFDVMMTM